MKRLILTATLTAAMAISGFSQGQITFQNGITSALYLGSTASPSNRVTSAALPDGGVVEVGLYWSTAVFTDSAQGTLADTVTMNTSEAGLIAGGTAVLSGTSPGEQVYVQVFAWDSLYGNPDAALTAGAFFAAWSAGPNNSVYGAIGAPELTSGLTVSPAPGPPIFGTAVGQFGRAVMPTPEPATIALGGLGAAALLMFRRRK
jgi:hypothetical protein